MSGSASRRSNLWNSSSENNIKHVFFCFFLDVSMNFADLWRLQSPNRYSWTWINCIYYPSLRKTSTQEEKVVNPKFPDCIFQAYFSTSCWRGFWPGFRIWDFSSRFWRWLFTQNSNLRSNILDFSVQRREYGKNDLRQMLWLFFAFSFLFLTF